MLIGKNSAQPFMSLHKEAISVSIIAASVLFSVINKGSFSYFFILDIKDKTAGTQIIFTWV